MELAEVKVRNRIKFTSLVYDVTWKHWKGTIGNGFGSSGISSDTAERFDVNMAWCCWLFCRCCCCCCCELLETLFGTRFEFEADARSSRNIALLFMMMWLFREETGAPTEATDCGEDAETSLAGGATWNKTKNVEYLNAVSDFFKVFHCWIELTFIAISADF